MASTFGLLQHYLMTKLKTSLLISIILTGVLYVLVFGVVPILAVVTLRDPLLTLILEKFDSLIYVYSTVPGILFTLFLLIIHLVKGPWRKILEAKPKEF